MTLLYGVAALFVFWWLSRVFATANPQSLAKALKTAGGFGCLGLAALMMIRGRIDMAMFAGGVGAYLLGWSQNFALPGWMGGSRPTPGQRSQVRSLNLAMELDHDTGAMTGVVTGGLYVGRDLADLTLDDLMALMRECLAADPEGARLLEAYLDRRSASWREDAQFDGDARQRGPARPGPMPEQEAYEILGLDPGADEEAIRAAHRSLIKKLHPDAGGVSALAARVNEAKDVLLKRHR